MPFLLHHLEFMWLDEMSVKYAILNPSKVNSMIMNKSCLLFFITSNSSQEI